MHVHSQCRYWGLYSIFNSLLRTFIDHIFWVIFTRAKSTPTLRIERNYCSMACIVRMVLVFKFILANFQRVHFITCHPTCMYTHCMHHIQYDSYLLLPLMHHTLPIITKFWIVLSNNKSHHQKSPIALFCYTVYEYVPISAVIYTQPHTEGR